MGLVAVAEVADVFVVRHIGLGQKDDIRRDDGEEVPEQLYHLVGLGQVNAGGSDFFPEIGNGVQPDDAGAGVDVEKKNVQDFEKDIRVGEVQVDLVRAERGPHVLQPLSGLHGCKQGRGAGAHDGGKIGCGGGDDEKVPAGRRARREVDEPAALSRDVVQDQVHHQLEMLADGADRFPIANGRIHLAVMDDGKAVIGGVGEKGEQVDGADRAAQMAVEKAFQCDERLFPAGPHHVGIGNEKSVGLVPLFRGRRCGGFDSVPAGQHVEPGQALDGPIPIEPLETAADLFLRLGGVHHDDSG